MIKLESLFAFGSSTARKLRCAYCTLLEVHDMLWIFQSRQLGLKAIFLNLSLGNFSLDVLRLSHLSLWFFGTILSLFLLWILLFYIFHAWFDSTEVLRSIHAKSCSLEAARFASCLGLLVSMVCNHLIGNRALDACEYFAFSLAWSWHRCCDCTSSLANRIDQFIDFIAQFYLQFVLDKLRFVLSLPHLGDVFGCQSLSWSLLQFCKLYKESVTDEVFGCLILDYNKPGYLRLKLAIM